MSPWREKGLNGYEDSCHLTPKHSRQHVGFVALGGNRDTCYIQLEGLGCRSLVEHTSLFRLHWWLQLLDCSKLSRIDLAVDDFHGLLVVIMQRKPIQMMRLELVQEVERQLLANVFLKRLMVVLLMNRLKWVVVNLGFTGVFITRLLN